MGLGGAYLFLSALKEKNYKYLIPKAIFSGIIVGLALASWGGGEYFVIPIAIFILSLAFVSNNLKNPLLVSVLFTVSILLVALSFPRPGTSFVFGLTRDFINSQYWIFIYCSYGKKKTF